MRAGSGVASQAPGPGCLAVPGASSLRTLHLNFARAALKSHAKAVSINKKKEKGREGRGPEKAFRNYPLKLEYSSRCFCFRPVLLSFQSSEISSKVIIHLITLIV